MSTTLNAIVRDKLGSRWARRLRLQNRIPCSIQGEDRPNVDFSIDEDEFATARRHHEHLFEIQLDKGEKETAMVRELQWNTLSQTVQHIEFRRVVLGRKTEVEVELEFSGHPKGGVLNHLHTHVTVTCLPSMIPDSIECRADGLEPGHPLLARDLVLPEGVELAVDPEMQIAVVSEVRAAEPVAEAEGEAEGAAPAAEAAPEEPAKED